MSESTFKTWFIGASRKAGHFVGRPATFMGALLVVLFWVACGPVFKFSDTWQLVINTGTSIITFLMVFLIQNTQNRDTEALQIKVDELIRVNRSARNSLIDLEEMGEEDLEKMRLKFQKLAENDRLNRAKEAGQ